MSNLDDLKTIRDNLIAELKAVSASPGPNYSIDGQSVRKADYLKTLREEIVETNRMIQQEEGPFTSVEEVVT